MAREAGPGFPPIIEEKPVGYFDKPCSLMQRLAYRSDTGGVSQMWLEGREAFMVERMKGMTPERRATRRQFLHDLALSPREPVHVPEYFTELYNPIRRLAKWPLDRIYDFWKPKIGHDFALAFRRNARNWMVYTFLIYSGTYICLFYVNDWQHWKRLNLLRSKPVVYPGDPDYPYVSDKYVGEDYHDLGFKSSIFYKSEEQIRAEHAADLKKQQMKK